MTVQIHLATATGPGKLFIYLEIPKNFNSLDIPQQLDEVPLGTIPLTTAGALMVRLPITRQVVANTTSGLATYTFVAVFGDRRAVSEASVPVAPEPGNAASIVGPMTTITFSSFDTIKPLGNPNPPECVLVADGKAVEKTNRIGQMQNGDGKHTSATFNYSTSADSTFGVGTSNSPNDNYTLSGDLTITNSFGGSGSFTRGPGFNDFVFGHFYRQRYRIPAVETGICGRKFKAEYVQAAGDAFPPGKKLKEQFGTPKKDPYGRCGKDPFGLVVVTPNGGWNKDRAKAVTLSASATIYNLDVSGSTGFTDDINIAYRNNGKSPAFVCGNADLPDTPILWSNDLQGK